MNIFNNPIINMDKYIFHLSIRLVIGSEKTRYNLYRILILYKYLKIRKKYNKEIFRYCKNIEDKKLLKQINNKCKLYHIFVLKSILLLILDIALYVKQYCIVKIPVKVDNFLNTLSEIMFP